MIAPVRHALLLCALSLALPQTARAEPELPSARKLAMSKKVCERAWLKQKKPRYSLNRLCAQYWLFAYNYSLREARASGVENALSLDPSVTGVEVTRFTRGQFLAMAKHARRMPKRIRGKDNWVALRAVEYFEGAAESKLSLRALNACSGTLDCLLRRIFDGQKLAPGGLQAIGAVHLHILRNAVYVRHGRRLKDRSLYKLFYTDVAEKQSSGLLPKRPRAGYRDDMLTGEDKANLALIEKLEKKMRKDFARSTPLFLRESRR